MSTTMTMTEQLIAEEDADREALMKEYRALLPGYETQGAKEKAKLRDLREKLSKVGIDISPQDIEADARALATVAKAEAAIVPADEVARLADANAAAGKAWTDERYEYDHRIKKLQAAAAAANAALVNAQNTNDFASQTIADAKAKHPRVFPPEPPAQA